MRKLALVGSRVFCDDKYLYGESSSDPDRRLSCMRDFKDKLRNEGIDLVYWEDVPSKDVWGYLFFNYKEKDFKRIAKDKQGGFLALLVCESEVVSPENWSPKVQEKFDIIFTWDARPLPETIKPRYIRYFLPNDLSNRQDSPSFSDREKLIVMVAANKWKRRTKELYTERFKAIRWFMEKHPEDLDLYGYDWKYGVAKKALEIVRNTFRAIGGKPTRPVDVSSIYRGPVSVKRDVLKRYRFCLCYENARDIPGYVTEKIFDCFLAGVVPIYMGWEGISDLIPNGAFINFRSFRDYDHMYEEISTMTEDEWNGYLSEARNFLDSDKANLFHSSCFSDTLVYGLTHFDVGE
ncbi:glycosyltransferase family 10 domain-containing protein [Dethiosulfovibrio salsuginis]|uniref:Glycosyltransferase family 10 (Fucosyltransferase) C-term n=1 Tax=Dethiosulfovibrio salsuginis TaxID=561720 RepID=A0A1X7JPE6_9BACT|nr:glycosyltransferase family 10 [Dethiosulfovibrio salsuginis]SMG30126.1 Glycosyltransferase family 10 (fucosyltransferase) C-term [Dethiosulfovibrio salsuginis]